MDSDSPTIPYLAVTIFLTVLVVSTGIFILVCKSNQKVLDDKANETIVPSPQASGQALSSPTSSISPDIESLLPKDFKWEEVSVEKQVLAGKAITINTPLVAAAVKSLKGKEYIATTSQLVKGVPVYLILEEFYTNTLQGWSRELRNGNDIITPLKLEGNIEAADGYIKRTESEFQVLIYYENNAALPGTSSGNESPAQLRVFISEPTAF